MIQGHISGFSPDTAAAADDNKPRMQAEIVTQSWLQIAALRRLISRGISHQHLGVINAVLPKSEPIDVGYVDTDSLE